MDACPLVKALHTPGKVHLDSDMVGNVMQQLCYISTVNMGVASQLSCPHRKKLKV